MLMLVFYAAIFAFAVLYILRALLMAGYDNLNLKHEQRTGNSIMKGWLSKMLQLLPLSQSKLNPRSIDHKVHIRFQKKSTLYYYALWACLFAILFLAAKIFLDAF